MDTNSRSLGLPLRADENYTQHIELPAVSELLAKHLSQIRNPIGELETQIETFLEDQGAELGERV